MRKILAAVSTAICLALRKDRLPVAYLVVMTLGICEDLSEQRGNAARRIFLQEMNRLQIFRNHCHCELLRYLALVNARQPILPSAATCQSDAPRGPISWSKTPRNRQKSGCRQRL